MTTDYTSHIVELRAFAAADDPAAPPTLEGLMAALAADFLAGYSTQELSQWPAAREAILAATPEARQRRATAALAARAAELHEHAENLRASVADRDVDDYRRGKADAAAYLTLTARQLDPVDPSPKTIPATDVP